MGGVGSRKHTAVGLGLQRDVPVRKPCHGVSGVPAMKGAEKFTVAARVVGGELPGLKAGVGDVASPAP